MSLSALALLEAAAEPTVDLPLRLPDGRDALLRVTIRRISMALTFAQGSAEAQLVQGIVKELGQAEDVRRRGRLQAAYDQQEADIRARQGVLEHLPAAEQEAARNELLASRRRLGSLADQIAQDQLQQRAAVVRQLLKTDTTQMASQHTAIVAAGVVGWQLVDPEGGDLPKVAEQPADVFVFERIQLVVNEADVDVKRARVHINRLNEDQIFALSSAIREHSSGGAGGRHTLEQFRGPQDRAGGHVVADEHPAEPPRTAGDGSVHLHPDVPVLVGARGPADAGTSAPEGGDDVPDLSRED